MERIKHIKRVGFAALLVMGLGVVSYAASFGGAAQAESSIDIKDAYARVASKAAKSGAVFMSIHNTGTTDDQLIGAQSDVAQRVELHSHSSGADGVVRMRHVEEGFPIAAGGYHLLTRGKDHVMLMGLTHPLEEGDMLPLTLTFRQAGRIHIVVPVGRDR